LKSQYAENLKNEGKSKIDMLESHVSKMKEMLADKTNLLDQLDTQNRAHLQENGQLKRTINEMESAKNVLDRQH